MTEKKNSTARSAPVDANQARDQSLALLVASWPKLRAVHGDLAQEVSIAWENDKTQSVAWLTRKAALDFDRKATRRRALERKQAKAVIRNTVGRAASDEKIYYPMAKKKLLEQELRSDCETKYRKSWAQEWNHAKAGRLLECLLILDTEPGNGLRATEEEDEARKLLAGVRRLVRRMPVVDASGARLAAGAAGQVLADAMKDHLDDCDGPLLWTHGSELRRFVARVLLTPVVRMGFGCTRKPTADEITVIWLLAGRLPEIREETWQKHEAGDNGGISADDVFRTTKAAVVAALKELKQSRFGEL